MKNILYTALVLIILVFSSCNDFLDINEDPNNPTEAQLSQLLPSAQIALGFSACRVGNENTMVFSDMSYSLAESAYTQDGSTYNNDWNSFFGNVLTDINSLVALAIEQDNRAYQGIGKILKAYTYNLCVDSWGDVPYSEAGQGLDLLNPKVDDDAQIYTDVLALLDDALVDLNSEDPGSVNSDVYYNGNLDSWKKLANTIKLRMYVNLRLVNPGLAKSGIESVLSSADGMITSNSDNFVFRYGSLTNPQNTHPLYQQDLFVANKAFYMSNYFMKKLLEKNDPRVLYYVYRQDNGSGLNFQTTPCSQRTDCPIGYLGDLDGAWSGYIGRDHGDPSGLPGDNTLRTTWGVYPAGGGFDDGSFRAVVDRLAGGSNHGAGVMPFITASMTDFWLAEAILTLDVAGDASEYLTSGIQKSMSYVSAVSTSIDGEAPAIVDTSIDNYVDSRVEAYDNSSTDDGKLNVIIEEKYFAEFGNGWEAWTDIRRTGFPSDRPTSIAPAAVYPLRLPYGLQEVNTNPNISQVAQSVPVFWDE